MRFIILLFANRAATDSPFMPHIEKSALVPYSAASMFSLVDAVERYPEFLPWCAGTTLRARDAGKTVARIDVDFRGVKQSFTTENTKMGSEKMEMQLIEGPFREFAGTWRFTPLGDAGCKVIFELDYTLANALLESALGGVFGVIANTMIERFVARAEVLYGVGT